MKTRVEKEKIVAAYINTTTHTQFSILKPTLGSISQWPENQLNEILMAGMKTLITDIENTDLKNPGKFRKKETFDYNKKRYTPAVMKRKAEFEKQFKIQK